MSPDLAAWRTSADQDGAFERRRFRNHQSGFRLEPLFQQRAVHRSEIRGPEGVFVFVERSEARELSDHFPGGPGADQKRHAAGAVVGARTVFPGAPAELGPQLNQYPLIEFARFEVMLEG